MLLDGSTKNVNMNILKEEVGYNKLPELIEKKNSK